MKKKTSERNIWGGISNGIKFGKNLSGDLPGGIILKILSKSGREFLGDS